MKTTTTTLSAKEKILQAAISTIRAKGYSDTTVDDICATAGVTKGAFFHHFESKEELAVAAADYYSHMYDEFFATAPFRKHKDPLDRLLGYLNFRKSMLKGPLVDYTCLVGTMVQEAYESSPAIRKACREVIFGHAKMVEGLISEAKERYAPHATWSVPSLALYTQAVVQGGTILAKADHGPTLAAESIDHLIRYMQFLFKSPSTKQTHKRRMP